MTLKPKVALAQDFLANLASLPSAVQSKVLKWSLLFQSNPTAPGINYETIHAARDKNLRSVRVDKDWRGIVFKPQAGDVYVLMYVARHDDAYRWAESRRVAINPTTGAMQVFSVETVLVTEKEVQRASTAELSEKTIRTDAFFAALSDQELFSIGTPQELLPRIRSIQTERELDDLESCLPIEAYEGLFLIAAGESIQKVLEDRDCKPQGPVNVDDFATALSTPESQSRFIVVDDEETMVALLNSPLSHWRVFLHPKQRRLAVGNRNGPMRVLGGAGTGKTVLAMHRAKWIAESLKETDKKILFTTFTKNLATDIEENLKTLCSPAIMARIEVRNLDAWVSSFLRRHKYAHGIVFDRRKDEAAEAWRLAMTQAEPSLGLSDAFYNDEFERVVLAQGVMSRDDYRGAKRTGRGVVLNRGKRDAIWPVFEEYRHQLASRKLKELEDAYRDASQLMAGKDPQYSSIVVDETQDFGGQALRLLRGMVAPGGNDLFFVGDGHQRIYDRNRSSMAACGINVKGRSRKLYLNYRTTEEIRKFAVAVLEGCEVDDLDEGTDELKRYKSISHGPSPILKPFDHLEEALKSVATIVKESIGADRSVCVVVPTKQTSKVVYDTLKAAKMEATVIGPEGRDKPDSSFVRIATMHRAKGLEFDEVVLLLPKSYRDFKNATDQIKRLQYVAITRAKRLASILCY
jgi:superfamily I DNA/RNA helicase